MGRRCLVIGASGQLGRALCRAFRTAHEVREAVRRAPQPHQVCLDLADAAGITVTLREVKPEWVLIAGAFCGVDQAETERKSCVQVNVEGPRVVAEYARSHGGVVVYYSTDQVFDGAKASYEETDRVNPLNVYAQSKVEGEASVRGLLPESHLVIRTAWLYGPDAARRNFVLRVIDTVTDGRPVQVPSDQWGSPTYTEDVAGATRWLLEREHRGTFHATGPEFVDRASFAMAICASFRLEAGLIRPVPTSQLQQPARRPLRVRLDCQKLRATGAPDFKGIHVGLAALRDAMADPTGGLVR